MSQIEFDAEVAARTESLYRIGDAGRRRRIVREALGAAPGERILDIGCGPGFDCAEFAEKLGPSGSVVGDGSSAAMLELAARRCAGQAGVELRPGEALSLPVEDASFDAALCVQVLEYVADPTAALAEMHQVLRSGGRVDVWDVDWATVSLHSLDFLHTERVLRAWEQHVTHPSLPDTLGPRMRSVQSAPNQMVAVQGLGAEVGGSPKTGARTRLTIGFPTLVLIMKRVLASLVALVKLVLSQVNCSLDITSSVVVRARLARASLTEILQTTLNQID